MRDVDIRNLFDLSQQNLDNWKKGKSGDGKKRLYKLLKELDYIKVKLLIEQEESSLPIGK